MPIRFSNPTGIVPPTARYSHAVLVSGVERTLHVSGQLAIAADGTVPQDATAQARMIAAQLEAALVAHEMGWGDVVKLTTYLTDRAYRPAWQAVRDELYPGGTPAPASTQVIVAGLADPRCVLEVELVAAK